MARCQTPVSKRNSETGRSTAGRQLRWGRVAVLRRAATRPVEDEVAQGAEAGARVPGPRAADALRVGRARGRIRLERPGCPLEDEPHARGWRSRSGSAWRQAARLAAKRKATIGLAKDRRLAVRRRARELALYSARRLVQDDHGTRARRECSSSDLHRQARRLAAPPSSPQAEAGTRDGARASDSSAGARRRERNPDLAPHGSRPALHGLADPPRSQSRELEATAPAHFSTARCSGRALAS